MPEPVRPARSRIPAITGAAVGVLMVVASGESPLAQHLLARDLGMPVGHALLGVPVHRAQQRVDVDERLLADTGQHLATAGQGDQVLAQH